MRDQICAECGSSSSARTVDAVQLDHRSYLPCTRILIDGHLERLWAVSVELVLDEGRYLRRTL